MNISLQARDNVLRKNLLELEQRAKKIKLELHRRAQQHRPAPPTVAQLFNRAKNTLQHSMMTNAIAYKVTRNTIASSVDRHNPPPSVRNYLVKKLTNHAIAHLENDIADIKSAGLPLPAVIQQARASISNLKRSLNGTR